MKNFGFYAASVTNGVYQIDWVDVPPSADLMKPTYFKDSLSTLDDNEVIYTHIDGDSIDVLELIELEYGIN